METPVNTIKSWEEYLPRPSLRGNKYDRGHVAILGADELTGATRLAATACLRIGAGLVTIIAPKSASVYRAALPPEIMVKRDADANLGNPSILMAGCGGGGVETLQSLPDIFAESAKVLDAGAIASALPLAGASRHKTVITPHQGEFDFAFPDVCGTRTERALMVAKLTGAVVVLKGAHTIIADPIGRAKRNGHASPYLASAGTGDVLAGLIAGLIAQGMPEFEACCAAVWIHGDAALRFGPGLVAGDIIDLVPRVLADLLAAHRSI